MIKILDYGVGNIQAFLNIYHNLGIKIERAKHPDDLKGVDKLILPGVGHFDYAIEKFTKSGLREKVEEVVLVKKIPILGICVGFQMMAKKSDEGNLAGLGWFDANVKKFDVYTIKFKTHLPHMGWNDVEVIKKSDLFDGFEQNSKFYFLHSYYFENYVESESLAQSNYGIDFVCSANKENIFGVQFHPEKSHSSGVRLLHNFSKL